MAGPLAVGGGSAFAASKTAQEPNRVYAGPTSAPAALPAFRALVEADFPFAVSLAPATSTRNVIQPTLATAIPFIVKGAAAQSANLQQWKDNSDQTLARVESDGSVGVNESAYFYLGAPATEGSLRLSKNAGGQLLIERYQGGSWVQLDVLGAAYFDPADYHNFVKDTIPAIEAYWRLNEASGTTAADDTGNANTGTYENAPGFQAVAGPTVTADDAIELTGGDRIDADFTPSSASEMTIIFWYKPSDPGFWTGTTWKCFATVSGTSHMFGFYKKNTSGDMYVYGSATGDASAAAPAGTDDWSLYAIRYSVTENKFDVWVNGSTRMTASGSPSSLGTINANFPRLGNNDNNTQPMDGYYSQAIFVPEYVGNADLNAIYNPS